MLEYFANWSSLLLSGIVIYLLGAASSRLLTRVAIIFLRPLRWINRGIRTILRSMGIELQTGLRSTRTAITGASHRHGRQLHITEIECALREPDGTEENATPHDLGEEASLLPSSGFFFKSLRVPGEYLPADLQGAFTEEVADVYFSEATGFFAQQVNLNVNHNNLYDDEEGAVIVRMFRNRDRRCFYFLDRVRRRVGRNALRLILLEFASFVSMTLGVILLFAFLSTTEKELTTGFMTSDRAIELLLGVLFLLGGLGASFFFQRAYGAEGQHNMRELSDFLTRHFALISNRFREASARATRVIQGDERDAQKLSAAAQKWQAIMIWLAFRPFFIESFVRNVYFQMRRNLTYYLLFSGVFFFLAAVVSSILIIGGDAIHNSALNGDTVRPPTRVIEAWNSALSYGDGWPLVGAIVISAINCFWQTQRKVVLRELDQKNWLGFDNLEVGRQMGEVIGKYAEEIGQWKGRFERG